MNFIDLTLDVPALRAEYGERPFDAGLLGDFGVHRASHADIVLRTGLGLTVTQGVTTTWTNVWDVPLEGGWRWSSHGQGFAVPFWELLGGPHLIVLAAEYLPPLVTASVGTHTGFGVTLGRGKIQGVTGLRAGLRIGGENIYASGATPSGASSVLDWSPWAAWAAAFAGVSFR